MRYPELAALDSTADQDLGLTIAYKTLLTSLANDPVALAAAPRTAGAYLASRVSDTLSSYAMQHVAVVQKDRVVEAFVRASPQAREAAALALGVDLDVEVPVTFSVPDTPSDPAPLTAGRLAASVVAVPSAVTAVESPATPETWSQWTSRMLGLQ